MCPSHWNHWNSPPLPRCSFQSPRSHRSPPPFDARAPFVVPWIRFHFPLLSPPQHHCSHVQCPYFLRVSPLVCVYAGENYDGSLLLPPVTWIGSFALAAYCDASPPDDTFCPPCDYDPHCGASAVVALHRAPCPALVPCPYSCVAYFGRCDGDSVLVLEETWTLF